MARAGQRAPGETPEAAPLDRESQYRAVAEQFAATQPNPSETPETIGPFDGAEILRQQQGVQRQVEAKKREFLLEEQRKQQQAREEMERARRENRRPVVSAQHVLANDASLILDHDGQPAGEPGTHKRSVRMVDSREMVSDARPNELRAWGYWPVLSRVTGKPLVDALGLKMECRPEDEARRKAHFEKGLVTPEQKENDFRGAVEQANSRLGRRALAVVTPEAGG